MDRGSVYTVLITLPYGEVYASFISVGMPVRLQAGERVLATGSVMAVLEEKGGGGVGIC